MMDYRTRNNHAPELRSQVPHVDHFENHEYLSCGDYLYEIEVHFAKMPEEMVGYQVCGLFCGKDYLYASTRCPAHPITVFDYDGNYVRTLAQDVPIGRVHGLWKDDAGHILFADDGKHVIRVLDEEGNLLQTIGRFGEPSDTGFDPSIPGYLSYRSVKRLGGPFNKPTRMVQVQDGSYFASDGYGNAAVHHFDSEFNLLKSFGGPGTEPGKLSIVHSVVPGPDGLIFVADRDNNRIQIFDAEGNVVHIIPELWYPCDMAFKNGLLYVAENDGRVAIFDSNWTRIAEFGHYGSEWRGHSIAVDDDENIYLGMIHGINNLVRLKRIRKA